MPSPPYVKMNLDGSLIILGACGGTFCDYRGSFLGFFTSNIGSGSVIEELNGFILGIEYALRFDSCMSGRRLH